MLTFRHHLLTAISFLIIAALACNAPSGGIGATEPPAEEAPPSEQEPAVEGQPPAEETTPPTESGFIDSPPLDVSTLPTLSIPAVGVESSPCMEPFTGRFTIE